MEEALGTAISVCQRFEERYEKAAFAYAIVNYVLISVSQYLVKGLHLQGLSIGYTVFLRSAICWALNMAVTKLSRKREYAGPLEWRLILRSLLSAVCATNFYTCLGYLDFSVANSIRMTSPIYVYFTDYLLWGQEVRPAAMLCTVTSFAGVLLIANPFAAQGGGWLYGAWCAIVLGSSMGLALSGSMIGWFKASLDLATILNYFYLANMFTSTLFVAGTAESLPLEAYLQPSVAGSVLAVGLLFYVSNTLYQRAIILRSASEVQPLQYILVVLGLLQDIFLFDDSFSPAKVLGLLVVTASTALIISLELR
jgi:drug/metabolite transporter (DMT)-like permease